MGPCGRTALGCAAAILHLAGCGDREEARVHAGPDPAEIDRLVALGYLDHAEETADPGQMRVVEIDRQRSQPGYRLYCGGKPGFAELIDREGRPVHGWTPPGSPEIVACLLLENGDILFVGVQKPADGSDDTVDSDRFVARHAWDGRLVWQRAIPVHHHVAPAPDGNLVTLALRYRMIPEVDATVPTRDDEMLLLDPEGRVIERRSLYDALAHSPGQVRILPVAAEKKRRVEHVDLIHANTIEWVQQEHLIERSFLYAPGNVLVTLRHQNLVAIIEWKTNRMVWAWGQDDLVGPHEGSVLPSGNVLIFDNGGKRGWSRILELDPIREEIVWEYAAPNPADFFTAARGAASDCPTATP